jgi:hypothetical protein
MEETLTPIPKNSGVTVEMSFYDALKEVNKGKKISRVTWNNSDYCLMIDGFLSIFTKGDFHRWSINDGDMEGVEWIVIK